MIWIAFIVADGGRRFVAGLLRFCKGWRGFAERGAQVREGFLLLALDGGRGAAEQGGGFAVRAAFEEEQLHDAALGCGQRGEGLREHGAGVGGGKGVGGGWEVVWGFVACEQALALPAGGFLSQKVRDGAVDADFRIGGERGAARGVKGGNGAHELLGGGGRGIFGDGADAALAPRGTHERQILLDEARQRRAVAGLSGGDEAVLGRERETGGRCGCGCG